MSDVLSLGCGNKLLTGPGVVNHDRIKHRPEVDVAWDLDVMPWPWPDNSFDMIYACSVLEHLRWTLLESVNECWRIVRPSGLLQMKLPMWNHERSWEDVTHRWHFTLRSCDVFDPDTDFGRAYSFYTGYKWKIVDPAALNKAATSLHITMQVRKCNTM